jgi:hypothetical protein
MRAEGSIRVVVVVVLLVVVLAVIAWNRQPPTQTGPLVSKDKPVDNGRKAAPTRAADPRDTARDRPDRERTDRR